MLDSSYPGKDGDDFQHALFHAYAKGVIARYGVDPRSIEPTTRHPPCRFCGWGTRPMVVGSVERDRSEALM